MQLIRKFIWIIFTIILSISIIFWAVRLAPGDPVERILGPEASQEQIIQTRKDLNLDQPVLVQFGSFLKNVLVLDFGQSLYKKKSVTELIKEHFPPSLLLAFLSISISTIIGLFMGVFSAMKKGGFEDSMIRIIMLLGLSFPIFSLAPLLVYLFSIKLDLFPVSEWGTLKHVFLPTLTLVIPLSAVLMKVVRNRFLDDRSEPWVTVLRSKGLSDTQIILRIIKVTLPTVLNVVAIQLSVVLAGTIVTETIFDIPGMGLLLFEAIQNRDYPLVQGTIAFITVIYMLVYFLIEAINEKIDPRLVKE